MCISKSTKCRIFYWSWIQNSSEKVDLMHFKNEDELIVVKYTLIYYAYLMIATWFLKLNFQVRNPQSNILILTIAVL